MKLITNFEKSHEFSKRIHELIPGGCHTYSKGDDQFPYLAPKGIVKGKGVIITDLDGNEYIDWAMGLTAVSLGHAYEPVLDAVRESLVNGENFQRPAIMELQFAEKLKEILPNFDMFKFAKNGSTVTSAAVKLSRAYTGRKKVAVCAEHPFFSYDDWFIGSTACNRGIPDEISEMTVKFNYNDIESVRKMFRENKDQIACLMLEAVKFDEPSEHFLLDLQEECKKNGTVFIIDEMITGFRFTLQGAHKMFGLDPDLATYGKAVGNGFSVCFLAGKKEIMEQGDVTPGRKKVFLISTTHGAEVHTLAAALKTIEVFQNEDVVEKNWEKGRLILKTVNEIISKHQLEDYIQMIGYPVWPAIVCRDDQKRVSLEFRTYFIQEMIKRGVLFQGTFTIAHEHTLEHIEHTMKAFDESCKLYKVAINNKNVKDVLVGDAIKPVFREIN